VSHGRRGTARTDSGTAVAEDTHRLPIKTLVSASIGNAVEWFDWTVYATFVVFFAGQFFPAENEALALIGATSAYALAFFFRPLGGSCSAASPTCAAARPGCC
jgi:MHS family alpha-ketoglutarate permease-like MFS transporter